MKAKLLFAILPALGLLAGCSGESKPKEFLEEESACQEVFGGDETTFEKKQRKQTLTEDDFEQPSIGIQYKSYKEDRDKDGNNETYYAVRYIAAVVSLKPTMNWTRAVTQVDGTKIKGITTRSTVSQFYNSLFDVDGSIIYPSSYGSGYKSFVAYTMYDIPANQANSYIVAYLTLSDPSSKIDSVSSLAVVTQIAKDGEVFSVNADVNGYFIGGTIAGTPRTSLKLPAQGDNLGQIENVNLNRNDEFGFFNLTSSAFDYYAFSKGSFNIEGGRYATEKAGSSFFRLKDTLTCSFWINEDCELYADGLKAYNLNLGTFFKKEQIIMIHSYGGAAGTRDQVLYDGEGDDAPTSFKLDFTATNYIFARLEKGKTTYGEGVDWSYVECQFNGIVNNDVLAFNTATIKYETNSTYHWSSIAYSAGAIVFSITYDVGVGKSIYLGGPAAGGWDHQYVKKMDWNVNNIWTKSLTLSAGDTTFKFIIADTDSFTHDDWDALNEDPRSISVI